MGSRTWIKVYCDRWLSGTLRQEEPEIRGIFADLLALAGSGLHGDIGEIKLQNGIGLTDFQVQKLLNISKYQWRKAKKRLLDTGRIAINDLGAIRIINWQKYQSEYERQKPYRNHKLHPEVIQENKKENKNKIENRTYTDNKQARVRLLYLKKKKQLKREPTPEELSEIRLQVDKDLAKEIVTETPSKITEVKGLRVEE